mmetsp:Transcript_2925/g.8648  ORF Transcript_2925/g.8648 Transcript_2925/m.8648 type:complete len:311 (+) Transcript_2925:94-1026(+)
MEVARCEMGWMRPRAGAARGSGRTFPAPAVMSHRHGNYPARGLPCRRTRRPLDGGPRRLVRPAPGHHERTAGISRPPRGASGRGPPPSTDGCWRLRLDVGRDVNREEESRPTSTCINMQTAAEHANGLAARLTGFVSEALLLARAGAGRHAGRSSHEGGRQAIRVGAVVEARVALKVSGDGAHGRGVDDGAAAAPAGRAPVAKGLHTSKEARVVRPVGLARSGVRREAACSAGAADPRGAATTSRGPGSPLSFPRRLLVDVFVQQRLFVREVRSVRFDDGTRGRGRAVGGEAVQRLGAEGVLPVHGLHPD